MAKLRIYSQWSSFIDALLLSRLRNEIPDTMREVEAEFTLNGRQTGIVIGEMKTRGWGAEARKVHNAICETNAWLLEACAEHEGDEYHAQAAEWRDKKWVR